MANEYDKYREALVLETTTIWPDELAHVAASDRRQLERRLHAEPESAAQLEYVRLHSGFNRQITVTPADIERLS